MTGDPETLQIGVVIVVVGTVAVLSIVLRAVLDRTIVPSLVAFMGLGVLLQMADTQWALLSRSGDAVFESLAQLGIIALLFRVGLESDLRGLLRQLPSASLVWAGNVVFSAGPGYLLMRHGLGYDVVPSLIAATALTATSVGVSLGLWEAHKALKTRNGQLLTDVAEMDDLSGVAFMALVFSVIPVLHAGSQGGVWGELVTTGGIFFLKLTAFATACVVIGLYLERRITRALSRFASPPELTVLVAGIGIVIAGSAELMGISAAIGALFAGIIFSRDPESVNIEAGFRGLFHLLAPFFFVGIGLQLDLSVAAPAVWAGVPLVAVAIAGKLVGTGLPALVTTGAAGATLLAVSMVPRAEITLIIMSRGRELGDWAVPPDLYAAFVLVSAATCLIAPVVLALLFRRFPGAVPGREGGEAGAQ